MDGLELGQWDCQTQLSEQEFELLNGLSLPLLEGVDALLDEAVFLSEIRLPVMVLTSEQVLLLSQGLILASQSQEVDIKYRVLLGEFNQPGLHALLGEVSAELLDKSLKFVNLGLLLMPVIGGIA